MKRKELVIGGTVEDATRHLGLIDRLLRRVVSHAQQAVGPPQAYRDAIQSATSLRHPSLIKSLRAAALQRIVYYTQLELERLASSLSRRKHTDELAWHSRNVYELNVMLRWILKSDSNLTRLWAAQLKDDIEIYEGIYDLAEESSLEVQKKELLDHIKGQKRRAQELSLKLKRLPGVSQMAEKVGLSSEHNTFYKLYSKLVHPTAWKLNTPPERTGNWIFRNCFLVQAQLYAFDTATRAADLLEVNLDDIAVRGIAQVTRFTEADKATQWERDALE